ncbi:MAG: 50S ribosomal protein L11 methyltransferase [Rhodospirillales bacterium]|nr:50S ribosomal protein L11 methyltransferase [Rhodospirillales bacterium]
MRRTGGGKRRPLQTFRFLLPERAAAAYVAAIEPHSLSVAWFDAEGGRCALEAVCEVGAGEATFGLALALAAAASGVEAIPERQPIAAGGWLAHARKAFPEQRIGRRFTIRGSHSGRKRPAARIDLVLDAAMAFGSGEHASTKGCLLALEWLARCRRHRLRQVLDLGTGSGILAFAAARLWHRPVLAIDSDPDAVRTARSNAAANGLGRLVRVAEGDGWRAPPIRRAAPYDLVLANILARPLGTMARALSRSLAPGGIAVLSGLLDRQAPMVLAAHRRVHLALARRTTIAGWTTLVLRAPPGATILRANGATRNLHFPRRLDVCHDVGE